MVVVLAVVLLGSFLGRFENNSGGPKSGLC